MSRQEGEALRLRRGEDDKQQAERQASRLRHALCGCGRSRPALSPAQVDPSCPLELGDACTLIAHGS